MAVIHMVIYGYYIGREHHCMMTTAALKGMCVTGLRPDLDLQMQILHKGYVHVLSCFIRYILLCMGATGKDGLGRC